MGKSGQKGSAPGQILSSISGRRNIMQKRMLGVFLSVCMVFGMMPCTAAADTYQDENTGETLEYTYRNNCFYLEEQLNGDLLARHAGAEVPAGNTIDLSGCSTESGSAFRAEAGSSVDLLFSLDVSRIKAEIRLIPGLLMEKFGLGQSMAALVDAVSLKGLDSRFQVEFTIPEGMTVPEDIENHLKLGSSDTDQDARVLYRLVVDGADRPAVIGNSDHSSTITVCFDLASPEAYETFGVLKTAIAGMPDDLTLELSGLKIDDGSMTGTEYTVQSRLTGSLVSNASIALMGYSMSKDIDAKWTAVQSPEGKDAVLPSDIADPPVQLTVRAREKGSRPILNKTDHYSYIAGYPDRTVRPQNHTTRAEVATIFYRMLTDASRSAFWTSDNSFSDVKAGTWFNNAISTMHEAGVLNGYEDRTFRPDGKIKRGEFAAIAVRLETAGETAPVPGSSNLTDISGHWAENYIRKAEELGYVTGYDDGTFRPEKLITRAEVMTMVNRVLERMSSNDGREGLLPAGQMTVFSDNADPGAWYYTAIQEATVSHSYSEIQKEKAGFISIVKEKWSGRIEDRDWAALEKEWASGQ